MRESLAPSTAHVESPDLLDLIVERVSVAIEAVGIAILVIGVTVATVAFVLQWLREREVRKAYELYRGNLGRAILLSLEFLVAADIIGTVAVEPTFHNLGVLGAIVLIRTFLSFALEAEINGHWPWKETELSVRKGRRPEDPPAPAGS